MSQRILIVPTDSRVRPRLIDDALFEAGLIGPDASGYAEVLIPAVLPSTLPISACPPRIAARLNTLRHEAHLTLRAAGVRGRVEIVPCRNIPALLRAAAPVDRLVLVGRAGWSLRRAARGVAGDLLVVGPRRARLAEQAATATRPEPRTAG
jgi:hypothetical protein